MKKLSFFFCIFFLLSPVFAEESTPLLYEGVDEKSITVINNPKKVIFEDILVWSEMNATIRKEINCKDHTIFIHDIRAAKHNREPIFIRNQDEPPRILLKTDKHYDIYKKYCL